MKEAEHSYKGPTTSREIPEGVARYLDGTDLLTKTQAVRLSTVDPDGWPHAALLSAGDMVMMPSGHIRFALFPKSTRDIQSRSRGTAYDCPFSRRGHL